METSTYRSSRVAALGAAALLVLAAPADAQEAPACVFTAQGEELTGRASPPDSSSAALDGGVAKVCFSSPRMRGREIMGGLVPFGQPWRLGANEPTTLHLTAPARFGDVSLEPGAYALYAVPGEDQWEIVVNDAVERWGIPIDEEVRQADVGSATVAPESTEEAVEALDIRLEPRDDGGVDFVAEWEDTRVTVPIRPASGGGNGAGGGA